MRVSKRIVLWLVVMAGVVTGRDAVIAADRTPSIVEAVRAGDAAAVRRLIQRGVDVNTAAPDGSTALHWAVYNDDVATVRALLLAGANARAVNRHGVAPIALAAQNGSGPLADLLLKAGADPNVAGPGSETALMTAARAGSVAVVRALLERGADVNARESWKQQTALMWAAAENHAAAIDALVRAGADVHARSRQSDDLSGLEPGDQSFTALLFAARAGRIDAARALLSAGANVNDTLSDGTSALVLAITNAQYDMAAFLLENQANPNAANQGWTALHELAWTRRPNIGLNLIGAVPRGRLDSLTLAAMLLERGADVNARITKDATPLFHGRNVLDRVGGTPFFLAAHKFDAPFMRLLLANGADPLATNREGTTPLMAAAGVGLWVLGENPGTVEEVAQSVKVCLDAGGNPAEANANGETPLHGAAYTGSADAVKLLAAAGAKLDARNWRGWTPMRIAAGIEVAVGVKNSPEVVAVLRQLMQERGMPVESYEGTVANPAWLPNPSGR